MLAVGLLAAGAIGAGPAAADSVTFPYVAPSEATPNPYAEWTVPAGVTQATFDLYGAQGAGDTGGKGAHISTTLTVSPGAVYRIYVGGRGGTSSVSTFDGGPAGPGGYNGGGAGGNPTANVFARATNGGGGSTDVREGGGYGLADRVLIAAGGGGQGASNFVAGSAGGDSDADGASGTSRSGLSSHGGLSGSNGGAGGDPYDSPIDAFDCPGGAPGTATAGGAGAPQSFFCAPGGGGGGGLLGGGGGGAGADAGGGGGGSNKAGSGTVANGDRSGDGAASVTYTAPPANVVAVDGPLTPFQADGSARFKLGTTLEIRVKPRRDGQLITGLSPKVNIVRTGAPSGPQTATVPVNKQAGTAGTTMRYSAQFGQYQFYAATKKSQFNANKDLATGRYRVDVTDPVFPTPAHKVARNFAIVP